MLSLSCAGQDWKVCYLLADFGGFLVEVLNPRRDSGLAGVLVRVDNILDHANEMALGHLAQDDGREFDGFLEE